MTPTALDLAAILKMQFELHDAGLIDHLGATVETGYVVPVPGVVGLHPDKVFSQASAFIQANVADAGRGYSLGYEDDNEDCLVLRMVDLFASEGDAQEAADRTGAVIWDMNRGRIDRQFARTA